MTQPRLTTLAWTGTTGGQEFSLTLDATTRVVATFENMVTEHPVETGVSVTDHIRPNPIRLQLDGIISNAPHYLPLDHAGSALEQTSLVTASIDGYDSRNRVRTNRRPTLGLTSFGSQIRIPLGPAEEVDVGMLVGGRELSAQVRTFTAPFDRVQDVQDEFERLRNQGVLLRVEVAGRTFTDMAIVVYESSRTKAQDAIEISLQLKQIRFGMTRTVQVPPTLSARAKKTTATRPAKEAPQESSTLLRSGVVAAAQAYAGH